MLCWILTLLIEIRIPKDFRQSYLTIRVLHIRKVGIGLLSTVLLNIFPFHCRRPRNK